MKQTFAFPKIKRNTEITAKVGQKGSWSARLKQKKQAAANKSPKKAAKGAPKANSQKNPTDQQPVQYYDQKQAVAPPASALVNGNHPHAAAIQAHQDGVHERALGGSVSKPKTREYEYVAPKLIAGKWVRPPKNSDPYSAHWTYTSTTYTGTSNSAVKTSTTSPYGSGNYSTSTYASPYSNPYSAPQQSAYATNPYSSYTQQQVKPQQQPVQVQQQPYVSYSSYSNAVQQQPQQQSPVQSYSQVAIKPAATKPAASQATSSDDYDPFAGMWGGGAPVQPQKPAASVSVAKPTNTTPTSATKPTVAAASTNTASKPVTTTTVAAPVVSAPKPTTVATTTTASAKPTAVAVKPETKVTAAVSVPQVTKAAVAQQPIGTAPLKPEPVDPYSQYAAKTDGGISKALFIGINYVGMKPGELGGCINDVKKVMATLTDMGWKGEEEKNYRILTEKNKRKPTKKEILDGVKWLVEGVKSGDILWMHFSGHGAQIKSITGVEKDGQDESIIPLDYKTAGNIRDTELHQIIVENLPEGATLYAVFDCCHSGTILDLRYVYDEGSGRLEADPTIPVAKGQVFMVSGCLNVQTSADLPPGYQAGLTESIGALSGSLMPLLKKGYTWRKLMAEVRAGLKKSKLTQIPQFESSRDFGLDYVAFGRAFPSLDVKHIGLGSTDSGPIEPCPDDKRSLRAKRLAAARLQAEAQGAPAS